MERERKEQFSVRQLKLILRILVWGTVIGGLVIWLILPWNVPIYHEGFRYYDGSKLPLLTLPALPFFAFLQEKSGLANMTQHTEDPIELQEITLREQRKNLKTGITVAAVEAVTVFALMIGILLISIC